MRQRDSSAGAVSLSVVARVADTEPGPIGVQVDRYRPQHRCSRRDRPRRALVGLVCGAELITHRFGWSARVRCRLHRAGGSSRGCGSRRCHRGGCGGDDAAAVVSGLAVLAAPVVGSVAFVEVGVCFGSSAPQAAVTRTAPPMTMAATLRLGILAQLMRSRARATSPSTSPHSPTMIREPPRHESHSNEDRPHRALTSHDDWLAANAAMPRRCGMPLVATAGRRSSPARPARRPRRWRPGRSRP
jgi:hypothetical protein